MSLHTFSYPAYAAIAIGGAAVLLAYVVIAFPRRPKSGFRVREADRIAKPPSVSATNDGAIDTDSTPQGPAHKILGVALNASKREIVSAHKKLMKRYHPDKIAEPGTAEWQAAQALAAKINAAKEEMLSALKK